MLGSHLTLTAKVSVHKFVDFFVIAKKKKVQPMYHQLLLSSLETFLPENVFLLLQSVVVSFIIRILALLSGFPDPSVLKLET